MDRTGQINCTLQPYPKWKIKVIFRMIIILVAGFLLFMDCGANGSKSEYGALQGIEYEERNNPISGVKIVKRNGYVFAGFPIDDGHGNTWVLLNAKHSPYYKQMPAARFSITSTDLSKIKNIPEASDTVIAVLETRIK
jgi:hypothetical protein